MWDLSLYGDLALGHVRKDGGSILKDFKEKNIIFLNNHHLVRDGSQKRPIELVRKSEFFLAARGIL